MVSSNAFDEGMSGGAALIHSAMLPHRLNPPTQLKNDDRQMTRKPTYGWLSVLQLGLRDKAAPALVH